MKHFVITLFNLKLYRHDKTENAVRTEEWTQSRFKLFERFCLPSVKGQTERNFIWLCFFDESTPVRYRAKIEEYRRETPQLMPIYLNQKETDEWKRTIQEKVTGLLDPEIEVRPSENQVDDLMEEILLRNERGERTLVTTLTKRMAEELTEYLLNHGVRANYIHSDVATLDRVKIMNDLREGVFDVLVGVNLLREGLDLPEVSLVAILDADKEGFLRSHRSLTQTAGRAARNVNGKVIMYADKITASMQLTIDETMRRREKQLRYNELHHITPKQITKGIKRNALNETAVEADKPKEGQKYKPYIEEEHVAFAADPVVQYMSREQLEKSIANTQRLMKKAAKELDFIQAAQFRDELLRLQAMLDDKAR